MIKAQTDTPASPTEASSIRSTSVSLSGSGVVTSKIIPISPTSNGESSCGQSTGTGGGRVSGTSTSRSSSSSTSGINTTTGITTNSGTGNGNMYLPEQAGKPGGRTSASSTSVSSSQASRTPCPAANSFDSLASGG
ncbi:unnamed protein product [Protopolystoma xenopodis]|uniref:Uncharacterized protein n=1 Tax=Protopolystoma xenopodis TaxID=117903 RepID=A0A3S5CMH2_9PLAT|nr:unnamed protein product [Protopolystoma xenopodis]